MPVFVPNLKAKGYLKELNFNLCVVGSRKMRVDDDYGTQNWNIFAPNLTIYGFDADEDACFSANQELKSKPINWQEKHIPIALSNSTGESTLYVTKGVDCSSIYPPNETFLNRFAVLNNHLKLDFSVEIETTTLDNFCQLEKIKNIDFLYLDIQGGELKVLEGAKKILNQSILGVQLEVEFSPLYQNQPLFSDLDPYLRNYGFALFDLNTDHPMCRRPRSISSLYSTQKIGQLLWADALYFRDPLLENAHSVTKNPERILKLACIADIFNYPDYAWELLHYLTVNYPENSQYQFTEILKQSLHNLSNKSR